MILHFIECLNGLEMKKKIETKRIFAATTIVDHSPFLNLVQLNMVFRNKNYVNKLKAEMKKKYLEIRDDLANLRIKEVFKIIWHEIGITISDDAINPFKNVMLVTFVDDQNKIYEEVIEKFCYGLTLHRNARAYVCKESVKEMVWPALMVEACMKHGGKGLSNLSAEDKLLMEQLAETIKLAADKCNKKALREKAENALELD